MIRIAHFVVVWTSLAVGSAGAGDDLPHALAMHGDIKYGSDFSHFDYVNPDAPKGGDLRLAAIGTFDNLNSFILKGTSAAGLGYLSGLIYNNLCSRSYDEPFTEYGELAESVVVPEDRSWVEFTLRQGARWHDGRPITVDDVIFSYEILTSEGYPLYRSYWVGVEKVEQTGDRRVKFTFGGETNRELPLIIGQLVVLPQHYWVERDFQSTTLEPPLGSGPYKIESVDAGRSIVYRRVEDYWGADLAVHRGIHNFDTIRFDYYRDPDVVVEALKAGEYDFRMENSSKNWATAYDVPAVEQGKLVTELVSHDNGTGMQGFCFNTRHNRFADPTVRRALAHAFDFEWANENLFHGQYTRTISYFSNTELASAKLPTGEERGILEKYRGRIPDEVFNVPYAPPRSDGSGNVRQNLRKARSLLELAGWTVVDNKLTHAATGEAMTIEFLLNSNGFERIIAPYIKNLERLGVEARIRIVDTAQFQNRLQAFDFDAIVAVWGQSLSPGNEQRDYWTSKAADTPGTRNYAGIKDPVVDELVELLIAAPSRQSLVARTRALDRVLLAGHYVVPNWHIRSHRLVYWDKFGQPEIAPRYGGTPYPYWWYDEAKAAVLVETE